jgi:hypothetical protein
MLVFGFHISSLVQGVDILVQDILAQEWLRLPYLAARWHLGWETRLAGADCARRKTRPQKRRFSPSLHAGAASKRCEREAVLNFVFTRVVNH